MSSNVTSFVSPDSTISSLGWTLPLLVVLLQLLSMMRLEMVLGRAG